MFEIGFSEMIVIGITALLALGPKRLPEAARVAGALIRKARALRQQFEDAQSLLAERPIEELEERFIIKEAAHAKRAAAKTN